MTTAAGDHGASTFLPGTLTSSFGSLSTPSCSLSTLPLADSPAPVSPLWKRTAIQEGKGRSPGVRHVELVTKDEERWVDEQGLDVRTAL